MVFLLLLLLLSGERLTLEKMQGQMVCGSPGENDLLLLVLLLLLLVFLLLLLLVVVVVVVVVLLLLLPGDETDAAGDAGSDGVRGSR